MSHVARRLLGLHLCHILGYLGVARRLFGLHLGLLECCTSSAPRCMFTARVLHAACRRHCALLPHCCRTRIACYALVMHCTAVAARARAVRSPLHEPCRIQCMRAAHFRPPAPPISGRAGSGGLRCRESTTSARSVKT